MTEGDVRVVNTFNPSGNLEVQEMKERCASLIDDVLALGRRPSSDHHTARWASIAATDIETACMYAVKALTHERCVKEGT